MATLVSRLNGRYGEGTVCYEEREASEASVIHRCGYVMGGDDSDDGDTVPCVGS